MQFVWVVLPSTISEILQSFVYVKQISSFLPNERNTIDCGYICIIVTTVPYVSFSLVCSPILFAMGESSVFKNPDKNRRLFFINQNKFSLIWVLRMTFALIAHSSTCFLMFSDLFFKGFYWTQQFRLQTRNLYAPKFLCTLMGDEKLLIKLVCLKKALVLKETHPHTSR